MFIVYPFPISSKTPPIRRNDNFCVILLTKIRNTIKICTGYVI